MSKTLSGKAGPFSAEIEAVSWLDVDFDLLVDKVNNTVASATKVLRGAKQVVHMLGEPMLVVVVQPGETYLLAGRESDGQRYELHHESFPCRHIPNRAAELPVVE